MEQYSMRSSRQREQQTPTVDRRPGTFQAPAKVTSVLARLPKPRLTGLGSGVLAIALMSVFGGLDALVLSGAPVPYGILFLLVSFVSAVWVRPADTLAAPVAAPLAFTAGLFLCTPDSEGFGDLLMSLVTGLSLQAGWLYAGTVLAAVIAVVRRIRYVRTRRALRRARAAAGRDVRDRPVARTGPAAARRANRDGTGSDGRRSADERAVVAGRTGRERQLDAEVASRPGQQRPEAGGKRALAEQRQPDRESVPQAQERSPRVEPQSRTERLPHLNR